MNRKYGTIILLLAIMALYVTPSSTAYMLGDVNQDHVISIKDVIIIAEGFGASPGTPRWTPTADVDADGILGISDIIIVASNFGARAYEPTAAFTETAHVAPVGTPIEFNPTDSDDFDGTIILYEWDWDSDGVYDHSTTTPDIVTHTYTAPGTYNVTLRVTDNDQYTNTATDTKTITQSNTIPEIPVGTILASATMIIALLAYLTKPKWKKPTL